MLERDAGKVLERNANISIKSESPPRILPQKRVFLRNLEKNNVLLQKA
jgi:hypothetical protein